MVNGNLAHNRPEGDTDHLSPPVFFSEPRCPSGLSGAIRDLDGEDTETESEEMMMVIRPAPAGGALAAGDWSTYSAADVDDETAPDRSLSPIQQLHSSTDQKQQYHQQDYHHHHHHHHHQYHHRSLGLPSSLRAPSAGSTRSAIRPFEHATVDQPKLEQEHRMLDDEDEDVKMAINALNVMKTGGPSRSSFDFTPPGFDPLLQHDQREYLRPPLPSLYTQHSSPNHHHTVNRHPASSGSPSSPSSFYSLPDLPSALSVPNHPHQTFRAPSQSQNSSVLGLTLPTTPSRSTTPNTSSSFEPSQSKNGTTDQVFIDTEGKPVDANGQPLDVPLEDAEAGEFLQRVGRMPIVSGVVRAYESGKATSRVVKYGADLVESSVTSISGRVVSSVGPERIAQIDRYAGAALDRLGQFSGIQPSSSPSHSTNHPRDSGNRQLNALPPVASLLQQEPSSPLGRPCSSTHLSIGSASRRRKITSSRFHAGPFESHPARAETSSRLDPGTSHRVTPGEETLFGHDLHSDTETPAASPGGRLVQVALNGRSRWQSMLVEASMTAGGIGAAVSEESMKRLKYCLQWLHYATAHLDHQISSLRDVIASLNVHNSPSNALVSVSAVHRLASIKKEVVETIRKVVDVVSKYAGGALPEQAKQFVRKSILGLPLRWASTIRPESVVSQQRKAIVNSAQPCLLGAQPSQSDFSDSNTNPTLTSSHGTIEVGAERVLTFAVESLDMLKSVTTIFAESVERADAWIERLRVIGIQHRNRRVNALEQSEDQMDRVMTPEPNYLNRGSSDSVATLGKQKGAPRSRSCSSSGRSEFYPAPRWRGSRDSSSSACDATSSSSLISGCDRSSCSANTANTTIGSSSSNHQDGRFPDRAAIKRRKGNGGVANKLGTSNQSSQSEYLVRTSGLDGGHQIREWGAINHSGLSASAAIAVDERARIDEKSTSSLKKILLDHDVTHQDARDEWHEWKEGTRESI